jgi:hypothetical protein
MTIVSAESWVRLALIPPGPDFYKQLLAPRYLLS